MGHLDHVNSKVKSAVDPVGNSRRFSSVRFLIITIGGIFLAEVIAMVVLLPFRAWPYSVAARFKCLGFDQRNERVILAWWACRKELKSWEEDCSSIVTQTQEQHW